MLLNFINKVMDLGALKIMAKRGYRFEISDGKVTKLIDPEVENG